MNFYKHYIGDFQRDTGHLSLAERGAYLALIHHYYATERALPLQASALYRIAGAVTAEEHAAVDAVLVFFSRTDDGYRHKRIDVEIAKADHQRTVNREIGKRGGRPKKTESVSESVNGSVRESEPNRNPNQTPDYSVRDKSLTEAAPRVEQASPLDPVKAMFDVAVGLYVESDLPPAQARSMVGRLRKTLGDAEAARVVMYARTASNPAEYMAAACKPKLRQVAL